VAAQSEALQGGRVVGRLGEDLGTIEDVMIDVQRGTVAYALLAASLPGFSGKLCAIPWSALRLDAERRCFVLDVDRERLGHAPRFDREHWPSMADTRWARQVHDYYGAHPYWTGEIEP
jgi:hypothetical protein